MPQPDLHLIPGIGRTFVADFARMDVFAISDLAGQDPELLYARLCRANEAVNHRTSKNYLYVIRMAVYYADGGRDEALLRWHAWKD
jgi:hypothetical protein